MLWLAAAVLMALPQPLQELRSAFRGVQRFEVDFDQEIRQELFADSPDRAAGRLMYSRPASLTWSYEAPKKRTIRWNGKELSVEDGNEKQVIRDQGRVTLESAFSFLWGEPDPKVFAVAGLSAKEFLIRPLDKDSVTFESLKVQVEKSRVKTVSVKDKLGGESILRFKNWALHP